MRFVLLLLLAVFLADFLPLDFPRLDFLALDFLVVDFRALDLVARDFLAPAFFALDLRAVLVLLFFLAGTLAPALRASDRPIAIACLRLFTVLPERPLFSVPRLRSCIAFSTLLEAFSPYFAIVVSIVDAYPRSIASSVRLLQSDLI